MTRRTLAVRSTRLHALVLRPAFHAGVLSLLFGVAACATTGAPASIATATPMPTARFDFTPTGCAPAASMKLTLAIVAPTWQQRAGETSKLAMAPGAGSSGAVLQSKFRESLKTDFLEIVACRGYLSKGPFDTFESMVFPDREGSNLLLEPVIKSTMGFADVIRVARCKGFLGKASCSLDAVSGTTPTSYTINGTLQLGGRVTLTLREPVTNTRMWTKSVEMQAEKVTFVGETVYSALSATAPDLWSDPSVQAVLVPALERAYRGVMTASDAYLNPRELQLVATQAADVRRKAAISVPR